LTFVIFNFIIRREYKASTNNNQPKTNEGLQYTYLELECPSFLPKKNKDGSTTTDQTNKNAYPLPLIL